MLNFTSLGKFMIIIRIVSGFICRIGIRMGLL